MVPSTSGNPKLNKNINQTFNKTENAKTELCPHRCSMSEGNNKSRWIRQDPAKGFADFKQTSIEIQS